MELIEEETEMFSVWQQQLKEDVCVGDHRGRSRSLEHQQQFSSVGVIKPLSVSFCHRKFHSLYLEELSFSVFPHLRSLQTGD